VISFFLTKISSLLGGILRVRSLVAQRILLDAIVE
jgi:hypothetical protein